MKSYYPAYCCLLAGAILLLDFVTGDLVDLAPLLFFPASLASWFNGRHWGMALSIAMPLAGLEFHLIGDAQPNLPAAAINAVVQIATFSTFAILINVVVKQKEEIRVLKGTVPTCAWCNKVRCEDNKWQQMEAYISERSGATFTHTICADCALIHFEQSVDLPGAETNWG